MPDKTESTTSQENGDKKPEDEVLELVNMLQIRVKLIMCRYITLLKFFFLNIGFIVPSHL